MSDPYFGKFPIIQYNGTAVRDISRRVKFAETTRRMPVAFYPTTIQHDTRSDVLAHQYYDDSTLHWMIHLANGIIDPYYGWLLTAEQYDTHIIQKFGNLTDPQRRISHWVQNWSDNDLSVQVEYYNNHLPEVLKKYFVPEFGEGTRILAYHRRQESWTVVTNRIDAVPCTYPQAFLIGQIVDASATGLDVTGSGEVVTSNASHITVKNVSGSFANNDMVWVSIADKTQSVANTTINGTSTIVYQAIDDEEIAYWSPVTFADIESERNDANKFVQLLDSRYVIEVGNQLKAKLNE